MDGEDNINHGGDADRGEVSEGDTLADTPESGTNGNGSDGTGASVESVAQSEAEEGQKEDPELLIKQSYGFRDHALQLFMQMAREKYNQGQEEHGGFLPIRCSWDDLEQEVIDLWFYICAMKSKVYSLVPEKAGVIFNVRSNNK